MVITVVLTLYLSKIINYFSPYAASIAPSDCMRGSLQERVFQISSNSIPLNPVLEVSAVFSNNIFSCGFWKKAGTVAITYIEFRDFEESGIRQSLW